MCSGNRVRDHVHRQNVSSLDVLSVTDDVQAENYTTPFVCDVDVVLGDVGCSYWEIT